MLPLAWFVLLSQDPATGNYINRIARKLSPAAAVRFVNDPDVRATPLPAGRIDLSTGLFARLRNEAELAGVVAHELAHRAAGTDCVRFVHPEPHALPRPDDRENERQADQAAIRALTKAGYDPAAMLEFFSKYRREGENLTTAYSAEDLLIEKLQLEATDHPLKDAIVNTPDFDRARESMK
jgi:predicted Zn-dependent protease